MELKEMKAKTLEILEASETPGDKDVILSAMFAAGIPFGKLNGLYRAAAIEGNFIVDPTIIKENIETECDGLDADTTYDDWSDVEGTIDVIVENVEGATVAAATRYFKAWCRDNEIELPKKPKASGSRVGGLGKVTKAMVAYVNATETLTNQGFYDMVLPLVKGPRNAKDYTNMYLVLCLAVKNGITGVEAVELVKAMPKLVIVEAEEATVEEAPAEAADDMNDASEDFGEME